MEKTDHEFCLRCGRKLKNPHARELGYGAVCFKKLQVVQFKRLFDSVVTERVVDLDCSDANGHFNALK